MPDEADHRTNHYEFWTLWPDSAGPPPPPVQLRVHDTSWRTELHPPELIGNPTTKIHGRKETQPVEPALHLLGYPILAQDQQPPWPQIKLANQFGESQWFLGPAALLLVPAAKLHEPNRPEQPPQEKTHYICYRAESQPLNEPIQLHDQFDDALHQLQKITILKPVYVAIAAQKNEEPIGDAESILAIYELTPRRDAHDSLPLVNTLDQFGGRHLRARQSCYLAVPSTKR